MKVTRLMRPCKAVCRIFSDGCCRANCARVRSKLSSPTFHSQNCLQVLSSEMTCATDWWKVLTCDDTIMWSSKLARPLAVSMSVVVRNCMVLATMAEGGEQTEVVAWISKLFVRLATTKFSAAFSRKMPWALSSVDSAACRCAENTHTHAEAQRHTQTQMHTYTSTHTNIKI